MAMTVIENGEQRMSDGERRVAFVGGASQGIGRAVAERLAGDGYDLLMCSRDPAKLEAAAEEIREGHGSRVVALPGDLSRVEDCDRVATGALDAFGHVDALFHNTGGPRPGRFPVLDARDWSQAHDLLLMSFIRMVGHLAPPMAARGRGRVVLLTSVAVRQPMDDLLLSTVYRAAATALCKMLSRQYAPRGVTFNCLAPGIVNTDRRIEASVARAKSAGVDVEQQLADDERGIPLGRAGEPEEIASGASFLLSDAASYVTGSVLIVDGGMTEVVW